MVGGEGRRLVWCCVHELLVAVAWRRLVVLIWYARQLVGLESLGAQMVLVQAVWNGEACLINLYHVLEIRSEVFTLILRYAVLKKHFQKLV